MKLLNLLWKRVTSHTVRAETLPSGKLSVGEGVLGHWHYHLHTPGKSTQALCGSPIMPTGISVQAWGIKTHLNERYCAECAAIAGDRLASSLRAVA
jgi:hypothetical protein